MTTTGTDIPDTTVTRTGAVFTLTQAAQVCQVSKRTMFRRLPQLGTHGAYKDSEGTWHVPLSALFAAGFTPGKPSDPDMSQGAPDDSSQEEESSHTHVISPVPIDDIAAQVTELRERASDAEKRAEIAEARLTERDRVLVERDRVVTTLEMALRQLPAASSSTSESVDQLRDQMAEMLARARAAEARAQRAEQVAYSTSPWTTSTIAAFTVIALLVIAALVVAVVR